jgi:hypothetical protein
VVTNGGAVSGSAEQDEVPARAGEPAAGPSSAPAGALDPRTGSAPAGTGDPAVDRALDPLAGLAGEPLRVQVDAFDAVHTALQDRLAEAAQGGDR